MPRQEPAEWTVGGKVAKIGRVEWKVIAVDTRRRLVPSEAVLAADLGQH